jgi:O-antigen/teichoic acid export membrane protein
MTALCFLPLALVPLQLVLLIAPKWALSIVLPAAYADATGPVRIITLGTIGLLLADVLLKALLARGFGGVVAMLVPVAVGVQLAGLALLVPPFGAIGAAWSFAAGTWAMAALLAGAYLSRFRPSLPRIAPAVRWVVALAAPVGAFLAADHAGTVLGAALVLLGLVAYVGLAVRLGLVPADVMAFARRRTQPTTVEARP